MYFVGIQAFTLARSFCQTRSFTDANSNDGAVFQRLQLAGGPVGRALSSISDRQTFFVGASDYPIDIGHNKRFEVDDTGGLLEEELVGTDAVDSLGNLIEAGGPKKIAQQAIRAAERRAQKESGKPDSDANDGPRRSKRKRGAKNNTTNDNSDESSSSFANRGRPPKSKRIRKGKAKEVDNGSGSEESDPPLTRYSEKGGQSIARNLKKRGVEFKHFPMTKVASRAV
ncbi:hypothetical protein B0H14DRAFT_2581973 [Mycena olivaceomarginata]|nr:hypothetical protein B0H14DRAFT_2581973 [Mycena olivaceomarginata]